MSVTMHNTASFFSTSLAQADSDISAAIQKELHRQQNQIELIASENIVSQAVLEVQGSVLTNKYAEGYPARRYYGGCEFVDIVEDLAISRAKELFNCAYANVQPNSGSQANQAALMAVAQPGDVILGMSLAAGGHLTHGAPPNQSGKWFKAVHYGVREADHRVDFDDIEALAHEHRPKVIIAGASAYARELDFAKFREIADKVGAYLMVDMAHIAGLVATGAHQSPLPYADIVTTTTHKTLRGPRGGMILSNNVELGKKLNSAVFPGLQGGPLMHVIAAKAVAFDEALKPAFKEYITQVVDNADALASRLIEHGFDIVSGGTDNHLVLLDLQPKKLTGDVAETILEAAGMTCNKNGVPFDPQPPRITSGVRLGTPAATTRGFGVTEFEHVGDFIAEVLTAVANGETESGKTVEAVRAKVHDLCAAHPIY